MKDSIHWQNVFSAGFYNTSANVGIRNSVKSYIIHKNSDCLMAGCNYQVACLVASKVGAAYHKVEHQIDLYYFFEKST